MQFVEGMRTDPEPKGKRQKGSRQPDSIDLGSQGGANRNVGQVPHRVRQMEKSHEVAHPTACSCIERWA